MAGKDGVGGKIARIREARKLSQAELADRSQVALGLVQQIEEGELIPSLTPLTKIARVLGVRMGTFLDDVEEVGPVLNRKGQIKQTVRFAGGSQPATGRAGLPRPRARQGRAPHGALPHRRPAGHRTRTTRRAPTRARSSSTS